MIDRRELLMETSERRLVQTEGIMQVLEEKGMAVMLSKVCKQGRYQMRLKF